MAFEISEETRENNRELCKKYPFLIPHNRWTDKIPEDWNYEYTELDDMPDGWRIAFGEQMCEELKDALVAEGGTELLNSYRISQIKEKYGELRWYDFGNTKKGYDIINKYAHLSEHTCIKCGAPATQISTGWISPWCDECAEFIGERTMPINEYYNLTSC